MLYCQCKSPLSLSSSTARHVVVLWKRKTSSTKHNLQDVDTKANEAYGSSSAPFQLVDNEAYKTTLHADPEDDEGYVNSQLTYDDPHTTRAATIAVVLNVAYGKVQEAEDKDTYDYIIPSPPAN